MAKLLPAMNFDGYSPEDRIDLICDAFEKEWSRGTHPDLVAFLSHCQPAEQPRLFVELLLLEWELKSHGPEGPQWEDYFRRFPQYLEQIETAQFRMETRSAGHWNSEYLQPGQRVAHFVFVRKLGSGGAGEVWLGHDSRLRRDVAIKVPRNGVLSNELIDRFLREARAAAQLRHPSIVPTYEFGRNGNTPYLVSQYIDGQDLQNWLATVCPTERESAELCRQVAEALHHAHEQGIVHRDLKPGNVLVDKKGQPYVTDFGLAKWSEEADSMTLDGQVLGTPAYMSPEQALGKAHTADPRTDVHALGVLLYEMLVGECPFRGDTATLTHQIVHQEPRALRRIRRSISRDLETICLKALEKKPDRRYSTAQEMAVDLRRFLEGRPILARRAGFIERGLRWGRRNPAIATLTSVAVLAFIVTAGTLVARDRLIRENRVLSGYRVVAVTTKPPGARISFVPLNEMTGEPDPNKIVRSSQVSPIRVELRPGDYLVVAVLEDGRFHEVYRRVPHPDGLPLPELFAHSWWQLDDDGSIVLRVIDIPPRDVTQGMVPINSPVRISGESLLVDRQVFRVSDFENLNDGELSYDVSWSAETLTITATYDRAMSLAEKAGKRLPTLQESRAAAAAQVRAGASNIEFLEHVAEWTMSRVADQYFSAKATPIPNDWRFVCGRGLESFGAAVAPAADEVSPLEQIGVPRRDSKPWIGFRCARSVVPRFMSP